MVDYSVVGESLMKMWMWENGEAVMRRDATKNGPRAEAESIEAEESAMSAGPVV